MAIQFKSAAAVTCVGGAQPLSTEAAHLQGLSLILKALATNTGPVAFGDASVDRTANRGLMLEPGDIVQIGDSTEFFSLNDHFVDGPAGAIISIAYSEKR